jgi:hypothetical protein
MKMAVFRVVVLSIEAASTPETSVNFFQCTWRNNTEGRHLHTHRRENLKSPNGDTCLHTRHTFAKRIPFVGGRTLAHGYSVCHTDGITFRFGLSHNVMSLCVTLTPTSTHGQDYSLSLLFPRLYFSSHVTCMTAMKETKQYCELTSLCIPTSVDPKGSLPRLEGLATGQFIYILGFFKRISNECFTFVSTRFDMQNSGNGFSFSGRPISYLSLDLIRLNLYSEMAVHSSRWNIILCTQIHFLHVTVITVLFGSICLSVYLIQRSHEAGALFICLCSCSLDPLGLLL